MPGMTFKLGIVSEDCFLVFFFLVCWLSMHGEERSRLRVWSCENFGGGGSLGFESFVFHGIFG
jgi:hypothetical protein